MSGKVIIIGGGQAGCQTAISLREMGFEGHVVLMCAEPHLPYQRPPLSKAYLTGKADTSNLTFRPVDYFAAHDIEIVQANAVALDPARKTVETEAGETLDYKALVLATGARVRKLPVPGGDNPEVQYLRTLDDADRIKGALATARKVVVIGGGFIGLEVAASARNLGKEVTVIEAENRLMARVLPPVLSDWFAKLHADHGVDLRLGEQVEEIGGGDGGSLRVMTGAGDIGTGLVVAGIGVEPETGLAQSAGIECDNGVSVDWYCRTSGSDIYAAGDCTCQDLAFAGGRVRLESVQNAIDQGRAAAATIAGLDQPNAAVPWFWSDQFDVKLQMVGLSTGHDGHVVRGDMASGRFSVFYFSGDRLIGIDSVNRPADHMFGRRLLEAGGTVTQAQAGDEDVKLKSLL